MYDIKFNTLNHSPHFLFDIDGTLTPARQKIDPRFAFFFSRWIQKNSVFLVSGSDYEKLVEQIDVRILEQVNACFVSAGNVIFINGKEVYSQIWDPPLKLMNFLKLQLKSSPFPIRTSNQIEIRKGMINFSIIGRECTFEQRKAYYNYDISKKEREKICYELMMQFPELDAEIGGQISIDIYPKGKNKGQIVNYFSGPIYFFGDKTEKGGNDYSIAQLLKEPHRVYQVANWQETQMILEKNFTD